MAENGGPDGDRAVAVERAPSGQHLEDDRAEREQVAARIHIDACDLFGSHVADGAGDGAVLRQPPVVALEPSCRSVPDRGAGATRRHHGLR
jgi:hypothetical protein